MVRVMRALRVEGGEGVRVVSVVVSVVVVSVVVVMSVVLVHRVALTNESAVMAARSAAGEERRARSAAACTGSGHRPSQSPVAPVCQR